MKKIKYQLFCKQEKAVFDEQGNFTIIQEDVLTDIETDYSESECKRIKEIAYNGEYTIEDDGAEEIPAEPSQLDRVESQVAYLAMMTGYTDILEV